MKLLGAGFLWISLIYLGVDYAHSLKKRVRLLENTKHLIMYMKMETEFLRLPVIDLLIKISAVKQYSSFDYIFKCIDYIKIGCDFPIAWKRAVENTELNYKIDEKSKLLLFGENFGQTDLNGQISHFDIYVSYFDEFINEAKQKVKKYAGLTPTLGFISGFMLFILLI